MKVEIYILNYNGKSLLETCLPTIKTAVQKSIYHPKIIVVDNVSSDESEKFVQGNFPEINFMKMNQNNVLCSFNEAVKESDADIVILLNNDLRVAEDFIDPLVEVFLKNDDVFLAAGKIFNFDGSSIEDGRTKPLIKWGLIKGISNFKGFEDELDDFAFTFLAGFGAFDRKKFISLGGYDPLYLPGIMEDMDICLRAWKSGYKCYYEPRSRFFHMGKASFLKRFGNTKLLAISHRNTYFLIWKNITWKKLLVQNFLFAPIRIIYAIFTRKWDIVLGFFWFLKSLPVVIRSRIREQSNNRYILTGKEIFRFFKNSQKPSVNLERLIGKQFDFLSETFPAVISEKDARLNAILHSAGNLSGKRILEIGCGKGRISRILKNNGGDVYGIDISESLLKDAKNIQEMHFFKAGAYDTPFKNDTFDLVIMLEVAEHIPDLELALSEISRVLKSNGKLIVVDRNKFSINNRRIFVPNLIIKRYHELKNEWMYPKDFPYREKWFDPKKMNMLFRKFFIHSRYSFIISDGEKNRWWHIIFRVIPQARHFVLWEADKKLLARDKDMMRTNKPAFKEFGFGSYRVTERVAQEPGIYSLKGAENPLSRIFCLRFDADEYHKDSFSDLYGLLNAYKEAVTIFLNVHSFKNAHSDLAKCINLGIDLQSHAYYHYTYNDYLSNRYNIHLAKNFLESLGIQSKGFVAPFGKWNISLMRALEDEGYEYTSNFSYDYLSLPSYPYLKNRFSRILEIPIFPVAPELFLQEKIYNLREVREYFFNAIDAMLNCGLPVIIYAHTATYFKDLIPLLEAITDYAITKNNLTPKTMTEIAEIWKNNKRSPDTQSRITMIPDNDYLGISKNLGVLKRTKKEIKNFLNLERLQLLAEYYAKNK